MENETNKQDEENINPEVNSSNEEVKTEANSDGKEEKKPAEVNYKDKFFYLAAEMDNMKKRYDREKENLIKFGNEKILSDLIEVQDNFERTIGALKTESDDKIKNVCIGIDMISKQFTDALKKYGLTEVKAMGEIFDPNFHEALAQEKVDGAKDQEIVKVYQNGYTLNGRLIRPAKVIVASNN